MIVDTSIFVDLERRDGRLEELILSLSGYELLSISAMTVVELAYGVARAKPERFRQQRERFLERVIDAFPAVPVDTAVALRAGKLNGDLHSQGFSIALADAIIVATALHVGYAVATFNVKHFKLVPGLEVVEL